jgi:hypothetical protein
MAEPWWKTGVIYQIYPRSFQDTPVSSWSEAGQTRYHQTYPDTSFVDTNVSSGYGPQTQYQARRPRT